MIVGHIGGAGAPYEIQKSLRFRASASAYLSRTPMVAGNRKTWTWSGWVKRGALGGFPSIFGAGDAADAGDYTRIAFVSDALWVDQALNGVNQQRYVTTALYRDASAHYHIVVAYDTPQATASDRIKIYVNGQQVTSFTTSTAPAQNADTYVNATNPHQLGNRPLVSDFLDGYLSEINFIDGQALDPSYFGQVSSETGAWIPKKYTGTYGTNGFYLPFNDGSTLANLTADRSGNGNNWTANNISLTSGSSYDWMDDTPTNNFAVLNAVHAGRSTLTNGNLTSSGTTDLPTIIPDSGTWYFERGGVSQTWTPPAAFPSGSGDYNFGQRPFAYSPPAGFKALCTKNLPTSSILNPKRHFDVLTWAGTGTAVGHTKALSGLLFKPDLSYMKARNNTYGGPVMADSVRGRAKLLTTYETVSEYTTSGATNDLVSFDSNGITVGFGEYLLLNNNGISNVAWLWKAGGAPVTNNAGSIQSQVSANPQAGFSIVTYTSPASGAYTVGHGLGVRPGLVIQKVRGRASTTWPTWHRSLSNDTSQFLELNNTSGVLTSAGIWGAGINSTTFGQTTGVSTANADTVVAYCFAEIPGYSKIGSYTGNGSADGPFVYCGFRPRYVLIKRTDAAGQSWLIEDSSRNPTNATGLDLIANGPDAEVNNTTVMDFVSNGFKLRNTFGGYNTNGGTYIFYAVAEQPFQFANAR